MVAASGTWLQPWVHMIAAAVTHMEARDGAGGEGGAEARLQQRHLQQ